MLDLGIDKSVFPGGPLNLRRAASCWCGIYQGAGTPLSFAHWSGLRPSEEVSPELQDFHSLGPCSPSQVSVALRFWVRAHWSQDAIIGREAYGVR
jgi:hypothetical protein